MATVSIQVPMLETKLPVQTVAKARCWNGRNGDTGVGRTGLVTRPGYPGRVRPAGALLQGGPQRVVRLGGAAEAARALGEHRSGRDRAAGAARGGEHADRAGERRRADGLPGGADGEVEEAVVVEVVEEEPAGDGRPELVAVLRVALGDQAPAARAGRRPGQQVDRPGVHVGADVLAGGADGQVPLADAVAVGRRDRGPELVEALGGARDPRRALEQQPLVGQPARGPVEDADGASGLAAVDRLARGAGGDVVAGGVVEVAGGHGQPEQVEGLGVALGRHGAEGQAARRAGEQVDRPGVEGGADVLARGTDHQVGDAVAAQDAAGQRRAEGVAGLGGPAGAAALEHGLAAGGDQPGRRTEQDGHGTGVAGRADVLARGADGQVEDAVVVEVARGQRRPELVAGLGVGLGEQRPAGEAAAGAHEDVDRAGGDGGADRLTGRPHGQVEDAVAVEVALGHGRAEPVPGLEAAADPAAALEEHFRAGLEPARRAVEDVQGAGVGDGADVLPGRADGQVGEPVVVEVHPGLLARPGLAGRTRGGLDGHQQGREAGQGRHHGHTSHLHHLSTRAAAVGRLRARPPRVQVGSGSSTGPARFRCRARAAAPRSRAEPATLPAMGKLLDLDATDLPPLRDPFLVLHLHGWTDAGLAAQTAAVFLRSRWNATPLATFDADELIDFRARRPVVRLAGGTIEEVTWSPTELLVASPGGERDALLLLGPEPDFRWRAFGDEVVEACRRLGVVEVFGLGAFPSPALHTDPVSVVDNTADTDLAARLETVPAIVELSSGIQTVLEDRLHRAGIPATGLWARVPPYLAGGAHPPAALALVQTLSRLTGVEVETTELEAATKDHLEQVEQAIRERPQIAEFVDQIRGLVEQGADERIPSGDEIAAELERFLGQTPPEGGEPR